MNMFFLINILIIIDIKDFWKNMMLYKIKFMIDVE